MPNTPPRSPSPPRMERRSISPGARASSPIARASEAARSSSPKMSDAFDERTMKNHFGNYDGMKQPKKGKTLSEAKARHAYDDAHATFQARKGELNPPKENTKVYLSPRREKQVAADYDKIIKSGATEGKVYTRGRLANPGSSSGNPKKSSLELNFKRNEDPLAATLGRSQDPRMGHFLNAHRISSIHQDSDSSTSDSMDDTSAFSFKGKGKR